MDMFLMSYVPAIEARKVDRACLFTLTDKAEQDDSCAGIYNKSLLYLVAHAFEQQARSWIDRRLSQGTPIAGMARFIAARTAADQAYGYERVHALLKSGRLDWVQSPAGRSEEHTSELQSLMRISYAVFCLKKKTKKK